MYNRLISSGITLTAVIISFRLFCWDGASKLPWTGIAWWDEMVINSPSSKQYFACSEAHHWPPPIQNANRIIHSERDRISFGAHRGNMFLFEHCYASWPDILLCNNLPSTGRQQSSSCSPQRNAKTLTSSGVCWLFMGFAAAATATSFLWDCDLGVPFVLRSIFFASDAREQLTRSPESIRPIRCEYREVPRGRVCCGDFAMTP